MYFEVKKKERTNCWENQNQIKTGGCFISPSVIPVVKSNSYIHGALLLTLSLELANDGVQEGVLWCHMTPSHRHGSDPVTKPTSTPIGWNQTRCSITHVYIGSDIKAVKTEFGSFGLAFLSLWSHFTTSSPPLSLSPSHSLSYVLSILSAQTRPYSVLSHHCYLSHYYMQPSQLWLLL